jgi:hypothetical protein
MEKMNIENEQRRVKAEETVANMNKKLEHEIHVRISFEQKINGLHYKNTTQESKICFLEDKLSSIENHNKKLLIENKDLVS